MGQFGHLVCLGHPSESMDKNYKNAKICVNLKVKITNHSWLLGTSLSCSPPFHANKHSEAFLRGISLHPSCPPKFPSPSRPSLRGLPQLCSPHSSPAPWLCRGNRHVVQKHFRRPWQSSGEDVATPPSNGAEIGVEILA